MNAPRFRRQRHSHLQRLNAEADYSLFVRKGNVQTCVREAVYVWVRACACACVRACVRVCGGGRVESPCPEGACERSPHCGRWQRGLHRAIRHAPSGAMKPAHDARARCGVRVGCAKSRRRWWHGRVQSRRRCGTEASHPVHAPMRIPVSAQMWPGARAPGNGADFWE